MTKRNPGTCGVCGAALWVGNITGLCIAHKSRLMRSKTSQRSQRGFYREDPPAVLRHPQQTVEEPAAEAPIDSALSDLVALTRKAPVPFEELCNRLDVSPRRLRELLELAKKRNIVIQLEGDKVGKGTSEITKTQDTQISPVVGQRQKVAHITDTHLGSKYCLRHYLQDFVRYAYSQGVREVIHTGDVLDGDYKDHGFETSHSGVEEQTRDLFEVMPKLKGLTYHAISGNHDQTYEDRVGLDVQQYIAGYFREHGRNDWFAYGGRGAKLKVRGALIDLWHPMGSVGYALSYPIQHKAQSYAPGDKPQILLIGHWHRFGYFEVRGIHAIAGGTFQGSGSRFSKSLKSEPPAIGGSILSWDLTEQGTIRNFVLERRAYFEKEVPVELRE